MYVDTIECNCTIEAIGKISIMSVQVWYYIEAKRYISINNEILYE